MITLRIDPELQALIPPLRDEERASLEASLVRDGCRDALVVWMGERPSCPACDTPADPWPPRRVASSFLADEAPDARYDTVHYRDDVEGGKSLWGAEIRDTLMVPCPNEDCDHSELYEGYEVPWTLLDGHHRYAICQPRGIDFAITEAPEWVVTREDAKVWIIQNQLGAAIWSRTNVPSWH
jgi:hypothetical protein